jgi:hypothetical protein
LSHGTCSYIRMYINAVANNVMLYLQHDFYNIIFKTKYKLYIALYIAPPPQRNILGAHLNVPIVKYVTMPVLILPHVSV